MSRSKSFIFALIFSAKAVLAICGSIRHDQLPLATDGTAANRTYYSYDIHGNVHALLQEVPGLGAKRTDYRYDLHSGKVNMVFYQYGEADQFIHRYKYDADNRLTQVYTSSDGFIWNKEADYRYNLHGPLARVELGEYRVQGQDYYYNLQGWIKGVNMPYAGDPGKDGIGGSKVGKDIYAYSLGYYQGDYKPINSSLVLSDSRDQLWQRLGDQMGYNGLYNGNIAFMTTDLAPIGEQQGNRSIGMQTMLYRYDQLHRIKAAKGLSSYTPGSGFATRSSATSAYDEAYTYDANGNILMLNRHNQQGTLQDGYDYDYYQGTNQLRQTAAADGDNYTYDAIGNLVADKKEGSTISWTPSGKVRQVSKDAEALVLSFSYDASGNRIAKRVDKPGSSTTTHYERDASGNVMATYQETELLEQPIYGSSRVGIYRGGSIQGQRMLGQKQYELGNHLGNVLAVITDNVDINGQEVKATVVSTSDYYAFGLQMEGRTFQSESYRYGFNGKEKGNEVKGQGASYDYGFRIYDPRLGRFLSVDPLAKEYPELTPYQFASNTPIQAIDLDGLEAMKPEWINGKLVMIAPASSVQNPKVQAPLEVPNPTQLPTPPRSQTFVGPTPNNHLSPQEKQAQQRKFVAEQNYQKLKEDISATSPFVGGGSSNNPFGFASTTFTAVKEAPSVVLPEMALAKILLKLERPVMGWTQYSKATAGMFKTNNGIHHATQRSQAFKFYTERLLEINRINLLN